MKSDRPGTAPVVSVIVPCRNEAGFIAECLDSILQNGYPTDRLEILVMDGKSEDGTRAILDRYAACHSCIRILDNHHRLTPIALNLALKHARGACVLRVDAHSSLLPGYISSVSAALEQYGADVAGGNMKAVPTKATLLGRAIVAAISSPFGVGNSHFRTHTQSPKWVDTVFAGCYRRDVFDRVQYLAASPTASQSAVTPPTEYEGPFNVRLARGQDMEFHRRLRRIGGKILLIPNATCIYSIRSDMKFFLAQSWSNGFWAILPFAYCDGMPIALRHLVPLLFVCSLVGSLVLGSIPGFSFIPAGLILAAYGLVSSVSSLQVAWRERCLSMMFLLPIAFLSLHVGYGLGSLWGVVMLIGRRLFGNKVWSRSIPDEAAV